MRGLMFSISVNPFGGNSNVSCLGETEENCIMPRGQQISPISAQNLNVARYLASHDLSSNIQPKTDSRDTKMRYSNQ